MKIFDKAGQWNWVDDNNVFVGFDNQSNCCESFGSLITKEIPKSSDESSLNDSEMEGFNFDTEFIHEDSFEDDSESSFVTFKLTKGEEVIYLTLYNSHNGYYSHGFDFGTEIKNIRSGGL